MNRIPLLITAGALALSACNQSPAVHETNASVADVAAKVRAASSEARFIRPGEWQSTVTIEDVEMPGMPPAEAKRMKAMMAQNQQHQFTSCLTAKDVEKPEGKFFTGNDQCRYDHFNMGGGKIDAAMRCSGHGTGPGQVMTMTGTYAPDSYQMRMAMAGAAQTGRSAGMKMQMRVDSRRVGECTAKG